MASLKAAFNEPFIDFPNAAHQQFVETSQQKYNPINNIGGTVSNPLSTVSEYESKINGAITTFGVCGVDNNAYALQSMIGGMRLNVTNDLVEKARVCEARTTANVTPATFRDGCRVCLKMGTKHDGTPHTGGMYKGVGSCPPGYLATNMEEYNNIKKRVACETNQDFSVAGCSQCYDNNRQFSMIDATAIEPASLYVSGAGQLRVMNGGTEIARKTLTGSFVEIELVDVKEQDSIKLNIVPAAADSRVYINAYLTGPVKSGAFAMDLAKIVLVDNETGNRPRVRDMGARAMTTDIPLMAMIAGAGKSSMSLLFRVPFSFLSAADPSSDTCSTAPVITKAESALQLESSHCFRKGSGPGKYNDECLMDIYSSAGCTAGGSLNPSTVAGKNELLVDPNGDARPLQGIIDYVNMAAIFGLTGKNPMGGHLSIPEWDKYSKMCTGKPISSPCDVVGPDNKLTDDCIKYLYNNKSTYYSQPQQYTTQGFVDYSSATGTGTTSASAIPRYCSPAGSAAPLTSQAIEAARAKGGVEEVKTYFNDLHNGMFLPGISNEERDKYMKACIGMTVDTNKMVLTNIGKKARYIKFLRNPKGEHIQISKLEVIDSTGKDVALNKHTTSSGDWDPFTNDKPVNGAEWLYFNFFHDRAGGDNQSRYWMVDLGEMKDVCFIYYYNRVDCCQERSIGMRMQLLDESKNVVKEEVLGAGLIQSYSYINPETPRDILKQVLLNYGNAISLTQTDTVRGKKLFLSYMQKYTGGSATSDTNPEYNNINDINLSIVPSSFRVKKSLAGNEIDVISMYPVGKPNTVLRHANYKLYADLPTNNAVFKKDASFRVVLGNRPGYIRLQSTNYPDKFIGTHVGSDGRIDNRNVYILKENQGNIDWAVEIPFQKNVAGPEAYLSSFRRYTFDANNAKVRCEAQGARLATPSELSEAQRSGAQWCNWGHLSGGTAAFPMQESNPYCGGRPGIHSKSVNVGDKADVNCFGPKPSPDFISSMPFSTNVSGNNRQIWSRFDV